jgi:hypothetical protein
MKKIMFTLLFALLGLAFMDASAGYRRCWNRGNCAKSCAPKCERACEPCAKPCKVDFVEEQPCPEAPCCVRYVRVEEPALVTKHVDYTFECPTGCTEENKAAGMMKAGETWTDKAAEVKSSY